MANVFDSWKKKYSIEEYDKKVAAHVKQLASHFRIWKICTKCNTKHESVATQLICNSCKLNGYLEICNHCNVEFHKIRTAKCCDACFETQPWKRHPQSLAQKVKFSISKRAWYQTEAGIAHKEKMSMLNAENMKRFNKTEQGQINIRRKAKYLSKLMKDRIANGTFTPCITNTRTHWNAKICLIDGTVRKFRSSWEAAFWATNMHLEFESLRIPWVDINNKPHSYIPDFYNRSTNTIYEIKPRSQFVAQDGKMQQAIKYCTNNNIKFIWINEMNILYYINMNDIIFDNEINKTQLTKVINATTKSKNKLN